ncbi:hypothetical protein PSSHI_41680 [Photobacterium sp. R1]
MRTKIILFILALSILFIVAFFIVLSFSSTAGTQFDYDFLKHPLPDVKIALNEYTIIMK